MPPKRQPASLAEEDNLARRVAYERERRRWSYEGLAKRMTDAGCPINPSALFKIEKSEPRRRIAVAELVAFAHVFAVPAEHLLLPPDVITSELALVLLRDWRDAWAARTAALRSANERLAAIEVAVGIHLHQYPEAIPAVRDYLRTFSDDDPEPGERREFDRLLKTIETRDG
jgi:transcriptional regulator with XRE-family HTH domain